MSKYCSIAYDPHVTPSVSFEISGQDIFLSALGNNLWPFSRLDEYLCKSSASRTMD